MTDNRDMDSRKFGAGENGWATILPSSPLTPDNSESGRSNLPRKPIPAEWGLLTQQLSQFTQMKQAGDAEQGKVEQFICKHTGCGKVFSSSPGLREHERFHTGWAPYVCEVPGCGRSFKWRSSAAMHKKSHAYRAPPSVKKDAGIKKSARTPVRAKKALKAVPAPLPTPIVAAPAPVVAAPAPVAVAPTIPEPTLAGNETCFVDATPAGWDSTVQLEMFDDDFDLFNLPTTEQAEPATNVFEGEMPAAPATDMFYWLNTMENDMWQNVNVQGYGSPSSPFSVDF